MPDLTLRLPPNSVTHFLPMPQQDCGAGGVGLAALEISRART